jgi:hypothetical protein
MMNRTFWAGFGVALIVILLPTLVLIDARSSSDPAPPRPGTSPSAEEPFPPDPVSAEKGSLPVPAPLPPLPAASGSVSDESSGDSRGSRPGNRFAPPQIAMAGKKQSDIENPEIVFSPERVRKSLEKDRYRRRNVRPVRSIHSGIRTIVYDPDHVYTIRTAVSHVTLIDLPEEAKEVYLGDSKLFLAEVFGARVKIKPITWDSGTSTNMIVYTVHKQFAFRLKVVPEGREDDLLTFYSPKSETVVNLNPIRARMEKDLARREQADLREKALSTLEEAGPSVPINVVGIRQGVTAIFLGFSTLGKSGYALFELKNDTDKPLRLSDIRLRMFRTSLFWEGQKKWLEGQDFTQSYTIDLPPHQSRRALLPADPKPLRSARDGYLAEIRVSGREGRLRTLQLEARGGVR